MKRVAVVLAVVLTLVAVTLAVCGPGYAPMGPPVEVAVDAASGTGCGELPRGRYRLLVVHAGALGGRDTTLLPRANALRVTVERESGRRIGTYTPALRGYTGFENDRFATIAHPIELWRSATYCLHYSGGTFAPAESTSLVLGRIPFP